MKRRNLKIKRPIVIITLGAILGIILGQNIKVTFLSSIIFFCGIIIFIEIVKSLKKEKRRGEHCSFVLRRYINRYLKIIFNKKILISFIIATIFFNIYTIILNNKYEKFYKEVNQEVELEAVIISGLEEKEYYNSYTIKGKTDEFNNKKFILYIKKGKVLEHGDKIKIIGEYSEPNDSRNYKGYNYKKYLQTEKIFGTIKAEYTEVISTNNTLLIFKLSNTLRHRIIEQIKSFLPHETSGLLIGLILGEKNYISDDVRLNFQKSSLAHILAVSGAHVSYIILGLNYIISINKIPKKSGYIFIVFSLIVFMFITNFSVSVIRACIMSIILILSKLFYRKADILNTIFISVLIIVIFNPFSINSVSMQLSYLGTMGVIFVVPIVENGILQILSTITSATRKGRGFQRMIKVISVPIAAQITILPIMIKNFNTISLTFLISNILAMPLLGISIIGGFILTFLSFTWEWGATKIGIIFNLILKVLMLIAKFCGELKLSNIYVITPKTITIVLFYFCLVWGICYFQYKKKIATRMWRIIHGIKKCLIPMVCYRLINYKQIVIIIFVLVFLIEFPWVNYNGKLKIYFVDVGQRR